MFLSSELSDIYSGPNLEITREHAGDYVRFTLPSLTWTSINTTGVGNCTERRIGGLADGFQNNRTAVLDTCRMPHVNLTPFFGKECPGADALLSISEHDELPVSVFRTAFLSCYR